MILDTSMVSRAAGWTETEYGWHYEENGVLKPIDALRAEIRVNMAQAGS